MQTLDEVVRETVEAFVRDSVLFTALDVSNKVKSVLPFARHRDVRDLVRSMFSTDVEPAGWARTPIEVQLADGSRTEAMLYHPLSSSWDLDNEYDAQKRNQASVKAAPVVSATVAANGTVSVASLFDASISDAPTVSAPIVTPPATPVAKPTRDLWDQMFKSQPSLFPRK